METVIGIEGSEEGNIRDNVADKSTSDLASLKQAADPIVYKLVRVDLDGRLVPATDDELREVEHFFYYESSGMLEIADVVQTAGCGFREDGLPDKPLHGGDEGCLRDKNPKVGEEQLNAKTECDDEMLHQVTEEERRHSAIGSPFHPSVSVNIGRPDLDQYENLSVVDNNKAPLESPGQESLTIFAPILPKVGTSQSGNPGDCSSMQEEATEDDTSGSIVSTSLKPDFSLVSGEINLEKLTIRELQETFRATFGRGTSVKDKQWLKRRIAMGLANSCEIPLTSFIIKGKNLVKEDEDTKSEKVDGLLVGEISGDAMKDLQVDSENNIENASNAALISLLTENGSEDSGPIDHDQRAAKRTRKPTKRYIEELSDMETRETVRRVTSSQHFGVTKNLSNSAARPAWGIRSVIMRPDSLGGSGVQVPCVSRIRRCRPRKSIITLDPSRFEAQLLGDAAGVGGAELDNISKQKVAEARAVPFAELPSDEEKSEKQYSRIDLPEMMAQQQEPKSSNYSQNNSCSNITSKGVMRRKHHRAWSLSEVVKLVDGVSRYGAGRWSEIKRISFASYSYRTSVDLKDKWRNLLKASFAAISPEKGMNHQRKPTSMPIPIPILLKVRELAEMNNQTPRNFKASSGKGGQV